MPTPDPNLFSGTDFPVASLSATERKARLRLIRSENVGPVTFHELINHFGNAETALAALPELSRRGGRGGPIRLCSVSAAEDELERATEIGASPLFESEPGYPTALAALAVPPPLIYVKGEATLLDRAIVAIVGSRQCSAAGLKLARHFAKGLGGAQFVVASGLARGIDCAAHEAALETGTVAVLAGGLDVVYPPEHGNLQKAIAEAGCLVSEMPPGFTPRGKDFPRRNRIISGLSLGVLVIEAARRSGSLVTARLAGEQGRHVFAVPGHPLDPRADGTNGLLKSGATLVTNPDDITSALMPLTGGGVTPLREAVPTLFPDRPKREETPPLSDGQRERIVAALGPAPIDIDTVVRGTGLPTRSVQVALLELALAGRIERHGSGLVSLVPDVPGR